MKKLKALAAFLIELARELAGENAYRRHLAAHGRPHSGEEWRKFSEHYFRTKYARPKCCCWLLAFALAAAAAAGDCVGVSLANGLPTVQAASATTAAAVWQLDSTCAR